KSKSIKFSHNYCFEFFCLIWGRYFCSQGINCCLEACCNFQMILTDYSCHWANEFSQTRFKNGLLCLAETRAGRQRHLNVYVLIGYFMSINQRLENSIGRRQGSSSRNSSFLKSKSTCPNSRHQLQCLFPPLVKE